MTSSKIKRFICIATMLLFVAMIPSAAYARPVPGEDIVQSEQYPMYYLSADGETFIEITSERHFDSNCFVAHIVLHDPEALRTCFPDDNFNRRGIMTEVARDHNAVFMVNADYCTVDFDCNFVIRNNKVYREGWPGGAYGAYFCIMNDGHTGFVDLGTSAKEALELGVRHSFSFWSGPMILDGENRGGTGSIHPRTFMGEVLRDDDALEYYIIVADGRSEESRGLTHYEEAEILLSKGCTIGYNLDGGGSSEMVFDGKILNVPSDGHERSDHDFIYVRYGD